MWLETFLASKRECFLIVKRGNNRQREMVGKEMQAT